MESALASAEPIRRNVRSTIIFVLIIAALISAAVIRSNITTSLDGYTFDEAYHIGAGVSYVKTGDFRLNPEHPPLTKLWVGAYLSFFDYEMTAFRPLADKIDERQFVENDVYNNNDNDAIQARARVAMFALNALLIAIFAAAVWRVLGPLMAVGATAFLAIDPTVAAHMPVVMTDLPVALLAGTSVLLAVNAFRTWRPLDLFLAAVALGGALAAKHSAIIVFITVALIGTVMVAVTFYRSKGSMPELLRKAASVAAVLLGAVIVLWAFYFFRYYESPGTYDDQFNRPLAEKISDVQSPVYRFGLNTMTNAYLFPRAYTWGMADTIRAGAEGRVGAALVFGELYYRKAPWFYFPGVLAVKLPIGLLILSIVGAVLLIAQRSTRGALPYIGALVLLALMFLFFLIRGSSYGGVRHMLPMFPLFALLAAIAFTWAFASVLI
jgi:dolichyl-phosphate-mannose--protein O-mannosyl transferase